MSYQENRVIANLVSVLLGAGFYTYFVIQQYDSGGFESTTISSDWGRLMLLAIGVQIVLHIIVNVVGTTIQAAITGDKDVSLKDERDHLIELRADQIAYITFGVGLISGMITLATGMRPLIMFNLLVYAGFVATIVGLLVQIYFYRRGF